jgi:hypothetical protein
MKRFVLFLTTCFITVTNASAQNVGIGTTTPAYPLTVFSSATGIVQQGPNVEIGFGVSAFAGYLRTLTNHPLHFATNNGPSQMVLSTTGELGLGSPLPNAKLHMVGNNSNMILMDNTAALGVGVNNRKLFNLELPDGTIIPLPETHQ